MYSYDQFCIKEGAKIIEILKTNWNFNLTITIIKNLLSIFALSTNEVYYENVCHVENNFIFIC